MPASPEQPPARTVRLRDGTRVLVRPIVPDDKWRLREGLRLLSPYSRYLRFHTPVDRLTEQQLAYLTEIDYRDHMAWVALNQDEPDEPGMGVARYVRLHDEPDVAEAAVTVLDRYQGRGLGTLLLEILADSARDHGIRTFRNYVLAENQAMLDIFEQLGGQRHDEGAGVIRVDLPLAEEHEGFLASPPLKLLRAAARGEVPSLRLPLPAWWPAGRPEDEDVNA